MVVLSKYRKLRHMSVAELRWRLEQRKRQREERQAFRSGHLAMDGIDVDVADTAAGLCDRARDLLPGHHAESLSRCAGEAPELLSAMQTEAKQRSQRILDGVITVLGHDVTWRTPSEIDWHGDPRGDYRWPLDLYSDLRVYGLPGEVDVKFVWELNRHQFLVELGRGWLFSGREDFAESSRSLLLDWIEENPFLAGVNWTSGLEVAMRALSWMWLFASTASWAGWGIRQREVIARSLAQHACYLSRHLSYYTSPYNHLIGEGTALYLLGIWLGDHPQAVLWKQTGRQVLEEHGPRQFYTDGFSVEQAVAYHFFTLGFLSQAVATARRIGDPIATLEPVVARAFQTSYAMRQPDMRWPPIGDFDSARSVPVYPDDAWDFHGICSLGCVLFDLPELKSDGRRPGAELYWLLGADGVEAWSQIESAGSSESTWHAVLPESGYAVAGRTGARGGDWLLLDAGPLAGGLFCDSTPSTAHGHADVLQLLYFEEGVPLLTDTGIASYTGDRARLESMRGPSAHNTLELEGAAVARPAEGLAWSHVNPQVNLEANITDDVWIMRGRIALTRGISVTRTVLGLPGCGVWVADYIEGAIGSRARWHWHLPLALGPVKVQDDADHGGTAVGHARGVIVPIGTSEQSTVHVHLADNRSPAGWQATEYGRYKKAYHVSVEDVVSGPALVVTFLGPHVLPTVVEMHECSLKCGKTAAGSGDQPRLLGTESIRFMIDRDDRRDIYQVGPAARNEPDVYVPLTGKGRLPAGHKRCSIPTPVVGHC